MSSKGESATVALRPGELRVSPEQVARYAGGASYRMNSSQRKLVDAVLGTARQLVDLGFVYSVHRVTGFLESGSVKLKDNRLTFPLPKGELDAGTMYLAFCICTLGGRLEGAVRTLMSKGDILNGLFLDAAGVAFLEALSIWAYKTLQKQAQECGLHCNCRFGPGYGGLDLSLQRDFFDLLDASSIGVQLNETCIMTPAKSISFFTKWTTAQASEGSGYKCASCTLTHCSYRVQL
jgi:hypothetical protein